MPVVYWWLPSSRPNRHSDPQIYIVTCSQLSTSRCLIGISYFLHVQKWTLKFFPLKAISPIFLISVNGRTHLPRSKNKMASLSFCFSYTLHPLHQQVLSLKYRLSMAWWVDVLLIHLSCGLSCSCLKCLQFIIEISLLLVTFVYCSCLCPDFFFSHLDTVVTN